MSGFTRALFSLAVSILASTAAVARDADTVYVNGNVYTVDDALRTASAIAIKDNAFEAALEQTGRDGHEVRFALEHARVLTPSTSGKSRRT
ncbi:MAG: hypothetical protein U5K76_03090 [Woeseiaceae bacterium]|nr:hypothetical protein [Woeseiaceae bacterium]